MSAANRTRNILRLFPPGKNFKRVQEVPGDLGVAFSPSPLEGGVNFISERVRLFHFRRGLFAKLRLAAPMEGRSRSILDRGSETAISQREDARV